MQRLVNKSNDIFANETATHSENIYLVKLHEALMDLYIKEDQLAEASIIAIRVLEDAYK